MRHKSVPHGVHGLVGRMPRDAAAVHQCAAYTHQDGSIQNHTSDTPSDQSNIATISSNRLIWGACGCFDVHEHVSPCRMRGTLMSDVRHMDKPALANRRREKADERLQAETHGSKNID